MYDPTDLVGDFDDDGNPIGDGTPDNPGKILYYQKNYNQELIRIPLLLEQGSL